MFETINMNSMLKPLTVAGMMVLSGTALAEKRSFFDDTFNCRTVICTDKKHFGNNITPRPGYKRKVLMTHRTREFNAGFSEVSYQVHANNDFWWTTPSVLRYNRVNLSNVTLPTRVLGSKYNDTVYGGSNRDIIIGGSGHDWLVGNGGRDTILGNTGNDYLNGGDGNDYLHGGKDNDTLEGLAGNDQLIGSSGDDKLYGGDGKDWLRAGLGNDQMTGGADRDRFKDTGTNDGSDIIKDANACGTDQQDNLSQVSQSGVTVTFVTCD